VSEPRWFGLQRGWHQDHVRPDVRSRADVLGSDQQPPGRERVEILHRQRRRHRAHLLALAERKPLAQGFDQNHGEHRQQGGGCSVDFEQSLKVTWGTATTTNSKTTDSTGITLYKRAGTAEKAYGFYPIIYETNTGTIRATYAVEPLASNTGKGFWISQYGQKPDLALNLPNRFQPSITETGLVVWVPTTSDLRKQMRGMRFYKDETGTTGEPIPLTGAATDGQMVHIEVPVYNYSVTQSVPAGVQVCYDASPYDPSTNTENASLRFRIGCTTLPLMSPRQITTASIPWNTKDASHASVQIYRIYVVLDPDNRVDEKYETETAASQTYSDPVTRVYVDPGQNNEGFSYATVVAAVATNPGGLKPQAHVGMAKDAIVAVNLRGKLVDGNVRAYLGRPLQLRITINSDKPSNEYSTLLLYDGDPDKGGVLIGGKQIFSGQVSNSAWFDWIPTTRGQHRLFAKVLQSVFDPAPGDNLGMLKVEVIPAPKKPTH
jgi:hypothetical protein